MGIAKAELTKAQETEEKAEFEWLEKAISCEHKNWSYKKKPGRPLKADDETYCDDCKSVVGRCVVCHHLFNDVQTVATSTYGGISIGVDYDSVVVCQADWENYVFRGLLKYLLHTTVYSKDRKSPKFNAKFNMIEAALDATFRT